MFAVLDTQSSNVVHRIALRSIGSPLWLQDTTATAAFATDLTSFIHIFRAIVRRSDAVGLITIPTHLFQVNTQYISPLTYYPHTYTPYIPVYVTNKLNSYLALYALQRTIITYTVYVHVVLNYITLSTCTCTS